MKSFSYVSSLPGEAELCPSFEFFREDDHLKLGSFGAEGLTIGCQCSEAPAVAGADSMLVAGADRERFDFMEPKDMPDSLFSSRDDLLVFSPDDGCEDRIDIHEPLLNAVGIF